MPLRSPRWLPAWLPFSKHALPLFAAAAALYILYGFGLDAAGMLGPDEPRYAAIGRSMADSGDWVTPRLWDQPWYEKPALLYWMTALGFKAGLNPDLAPRVPVALTSVAFLIFFSICLRREYGGWPAIYSTTILATSAGWLTFSHIGVTDLPLAVCFSVAMLLVLPGSAPPKPVWAGVFLGLAILAKGLVPLVLIVPAFWFVRKRWTAIAILLAVALAVAAPWYGLVIARNGQPFIDEFFWKHHFARFTNGSLQHVRPVWFFVPVLVAGIFPWTPLLPLLFHRQVLAGARSQFLLAWVVFGLVFFSLSENKLPGYVLPLLPAIAALLGARLAQTNHAAWLLGAAAALLWSIPLVAKLLPAALLQGATNVSLSWPIGLILGGVLTAFLVAFICIKSGRAAAVAMIGTGVVGAVLFLIQTTFLALDQSDSARGFWRTHGVPTCLDSGTRSWQYGLDYYARKQVPDCDSRP